MLRFSYKFLFGVVATPSIINEAMDNFEPGSKSATTTKKACVALRSQGSPTDCPCIIGGKPYTTKSSFFQVMPSDHQHALAKGYHASTELANKAIENSLQTFTTWSTTPFRDRAAIFLKAAHLLSTKYRDEIRAATMLGQSKNPWQAEIDCVAEACDFLRWNVHFAEELYRVQPYSDPRSGMWNMTDYRPLEGFCTAITPFNFTAIAANLAGTPALMGNTVIWKPSPTALLSNFLMLRIFQEAGLPDGVINFLPCEPGVMDEVVHSHRSLAGCFFTGSTKVFLDINKKVYSRLETYANYPRISGETGGKDFHLIHPSADLKLVAAATTRAAFEYQGQKCSACSRIFVPKSQWNEFKNLLLMGVKQIKMGQPDDFSSFMCAVIDDKAFAKNKKYIDLAMEDSSNYTVLTGGKCDNSRGYFIEPTVILSKQPRSPLLCEEIFGPVLTAYVYDDGKPNFWKEVCELVDTSTKYGLTGAIFSNDRSSIQEADRHLRYACGNYYVNDKCTGAVVGQQPFGGSRQSGSNDKPGSALFLNRFVSARSIKESLDVRPVISYPHQLPDQYTL